MAQIEFFAPAELIDRIPHPYPASKAVPEWMKNLPSEAGGGPTLKKCPPFLQAMTAGYIIPAPFDVEFEYGADGVFGFKSEWKAMSAHFPSQVAGTPLGRAVVIKIHSPWVLRTPAGYSTLFVPPINRFECPVQPLTGIVETDEYYREVHLPSVYGLGRGSRYTLKRGAPLVQVIPILREGWSLAVGAMDPELRRAADEPFVKDRDAYKQQHWRKLEYL